MVRRLLKLEEMGMDREEILFDRLSDVVMYLQEIKIELAEINERENKKHRK